MRRASHKERRLYDQTSSQKISIRLDPDVIDKFKATGPKWQSKINEVLKRAKVSRREG